MTERAHRESWVLNLTIPGPKVHPAHVVSGGQDRTTRRPICSLTETSTHRLWQVHNFLCLDFLPGATRMTGTSPGQGLGATHKVPIYTQPGPSSPVSTGRRGVLPHPHSVNVSPILETPFPLSDRVG
jgi:hypothetical protein